MRQKVLNMFSFLLFLFLPFSERSQTARRIWASKPRAQIILYIYQKSATQRSANFALRFPDKESSKTPKKNQTSRLRKKLKSHSAATTFTTSSNINYRHLIRDCLEFHLCSNHSQDLRTQLRVNHQQESRSHSAVTVLSLFKNASNIPKITFLPTKDSAIGHFL